MAQYFHTETYVISLFHINSIQYELFLVRFNELLRHLLPLYGPHVGKVPVVTM